MAKGFWDHFDDLFGSMDKMMDKLPDYIEKYTDKYTHDTSTSVVTHGSKTVKIVTRNNKTTVTVNGKEYTEPGKDKSNG